MTRYYFRDGQVWDGMRSIFNIKDPYQAAQAVTALNSQTALTRAYMEKVHDLDIEKDTLATENADLTRRVQELEAELTHDAEVHETFQDHIRDALMHHAMKFYNPHKRNPDKPTIYHHLGDYITKLEALLSQYELSENGKPGECAYCGIRSYGQVKNLSGADCCQECYLERTDGTKHFIPATDESTAPTCATCGGTGRIRDHFGAPDAYFVCYDCTPNDHASVEPDDDTQPMGILPCGHMQDGTCDVDCDGSECYTPIEWCHGCQEYRTNTYLVPDTSGSELIYSICPICDTAPVQPLDSEDA